MNTVSLVYIMFLVHVSFRLYISRSELGVVPNCRVRVVVMCISVASIRRFLSFNVFIVSLIEAISLTREWV